MKSNEIRKLFLDYFTQKKHKVLPSFSLIPYKDPSLLLINAGMAPMKPYFLGEIQPPALRLATSQKCIRVIDIEQVGITLRHLTFFEMLGNFSFGDYFKEEAINFAWEFLTEKCLLPKEKLWISVHTTDIQAFEIWNKKIGIEKNKIISLGDEHNWWAAGETGPCGPDSEIYYELTNKCTLQNKSQKVKESESQENEIQNSKLDCLPGCDCDRFLEVWNLVFMQYNRDKEGKLSSLPKQNIDTGMGLERLTMIMQNAPTPYHTDLFSPIIKKFVSIVQNFPKLQNYDYYEDKNIRIIADHLRAITFLISDGVFPSNEGRGYVLRRLIRRVFLKGRKFGLTEPYLYKIIPTVCEIFSKNFSELNEKNISQTLKDEEENFSLVLTKGLNLLMKETEKSKIKNQKLKILPGEIAFLLYDTYGFPFELTKEVCAEEKIKVDEKKFVEEMEKQRERARKIVSKNNFTMKEIPLDLPTTFVGYHKTKIQEQIKALFNEEGKPLTSLKEDSTGIMVFSASPFYVESGGQVNDKGIIYTENSQAEIFNLQKNKNTILHFVKVLKGKFKIGDVATLQIDLEKRLATARHHTATHLLQSALRQVLGNTVKQSGSLVCADYLRFDFTFNRGLTKEEITKIENIVQTEILKNTQTKIIETTLEEATKKGALAFFGDKYGNNVRLVELENFSLELCGGTHTKSTGEIGILKIISEESIGAGLRRLEAVCGLAALNLIQQNFAILDNLNILLKSTYSNLTLDVQKILQNLKQKEEEIKKINNKLIKIKAENILSSLNTNIVIEVIENYSLNDLRHLAEKLLQKNKNILMVLFSQYNNKVNVVVAGDKDLALKLNLEAGKIVKEISTLLGGSGGGRPDFACGGGINIEKLPEAKKFAETLIKNKCKN